MLFFTFMILQNKCKNLGKKANEFVLMVPIFSGKFQKQRSYEHTSVFDAVMLSIENLNEYHKTLYKSLAVFLDDVGIPSKVRIILFLWLWVLLYFCFCFRNLGVALFDTVLGWLRTPRLLSIAETKVFALEALMMCNETKKCFKSTISKIYTYHFK